MSNTSNRLLNTKFVEGISTFENFIKNAFAERNTNSWSTYADAAGAQPVDGTGGSPNITWTTDTTVLIGARSFLLTKDAANRQGQGVSYPFTINSADAAKPMVIKGSYYLQSGSTYSGGSSSTDSDLTVYIYDIDNSTIIQPAGYKITGAVNQQYYDFSATFQTSSNSLNYRLIFHIATTSASAWSMNFDNISISRQPYVIGSPITDWVAFTPTGSWSTNTTYTGFWRRVGESMDLQIKVAVSGAPTSAALTINMPSGYSIDTAKLVGTSGAAGSPHLAVVSLLDSGSDNYVGQVRYTSATVLRIQKDDGDGTVSDVTQAAPFTFANGDTVEIKITGLPILGWGSSVQMSNDTDTRVCFARYSSNVAQVIANSTITIFDFEDKENDSHGAVTTGASWKFTAPIPGFYIVSSFVKFQSATGWANGEEVDIHLYKNNSRVCYMGLTRFNATVTAESQAFGTSGVYLNAGDYIDVRISHNNGSSITSIGTTDEQWVTIHRLSGPSAIAANESVLARYSTNTAQSMVTGSSTLVDFEDKDYDSHGAVTTGASWKFTAPVAGKYRVTASLSMASQAGWANGEILHIQIFKNGSVQSRIGCWIAQATITAAAWATGSGEVNLLAGEYIDLRAFHNNGSNHNTSAEPLECWIAISKIGN